MKRSLDFALLKETLLRKEKGYTATVDCVDLDDKENYSLLKVIKVNQVKTSNPKVTQYLQRRFNQVKQNAISQ